MNNMGDFLQKHIERVEDYKGNLSCSSYMPAQEYMEADHFLGNYIGELKRLVPQITTATQIPILIGDIVKVKGKEDRGPISLMVVMPGLTDTDDNNQTYRHATYMSPIGSSLLLKKTGDHVLVHIGEKDYEYEIQAIIRGEGE